MTKSNVTYYFLLVSLALSHGVIIANVLPEAKQQAKATGEKVSQAKESFSLSAISNILDDPQLKKLVDNDAQKSEGIEIIFVSSIDMLLKYVFFIKYSTK
jgi:hypothetical protein